MGRVRGGEAKRRRRGSGAETTETLDHSVPMTISTGILQRFYHLVLPLDQYLALLLPSDTADLLRPCKNAATSTSTSSSTTPPPDAYQQLAAAFVAIPDPREAARLRSIQRDPSASANRGIWSSWKRPRPPTSKQGDGLESEAEAEADQISQVRRDLSPPLDHLRTPHALNWSHIRSIRSLKMGWNLGP